MWLWLRSPCRLFALGSVVRSRVMHVMIVPRVLVLLLLVLRSMGVAAWVAHMVVALHWLGCMVVVVAPGRRLARPHDWRVRATPLVPSPANGGTMLNCVVGTPPAAGAR